MQDMLDDSPDFFQELKEAAWNVLHENPGCEYGDWVNILVEQYPAEIVDALGANPPEVFAALSDLWDCDDYTDEDTDECHTFAEWSEYFATERSVELYDALAEARLKIRLLYR